MGLTAPYSRRDSTLTRLAHAAITPPAKGHASSKGGGTLSVAVFTPAVKAPASKARYILELFDNSAEEGLSVVASLESLRAVYRAVGQALAATNTTGTVLPLNQPGAPGGSLGGGLA